MSKCGLFLLILLVTWGILAACVLSSLLWFQQSFCNYVIL
jgi:hypothetical protein